MSAWFASIGEFFSSHWQSLVDTFITTGYWKYLAEGVGSTLRITLLACLIGVAIGVVIACIRVTYDKNIETIRRGVGRVALKFFNTLCKIYLTVIRGTPVVVQLFIMVLIIFASSNKVNTAILTFGINSGAYVAEIIRSGIMSLDKGQFEAGRSLGFNYLQTMRYIIMPQALRNVLPALANEFIALLKETSVAGYAAVGELTRAGQKIQSLTYNSLYSYGSIAVIYLALVMFFTFLVGRLERRLQKSEH